MKKVVTFGEVMWRLSPPGHKKLQQTEQLNVTLGGAEANVAVALSLLGMETQLVTRIPDNELSTCILQSLRKYGVNMEYVLSGGKRLGLYFVEVGAINRATRVIYDRERSSFSEITPGMFDWEKILDGAAWFHFSGITPAVSENAAKVCLEAVKTAQKKGIKISIDLNYRQKLWNYGKSPSTVMPELVSYCDLLASDIHSCNVMLDLSVPKLAPITYPVSSDQLKTMFDLLIAQFPNVKMGASVIRDIVHNSHHKLKGVFYQKDKLAETDEFDVYPIIDRLGGGDAFMAGLLFGLSQYEDSHKAVEFATAYSALKHSILGDFNLVTREETEQLMQGNKKGIISR